MRALGVPITIYVDDYLPTYGGNLMFASAGKDQSVWAAIVEKAFSKRYGNYQHTIGGWMAVGVAQLNGSPYTTFEHASLNEEALWGILSTHDAKDYILKDWTGDEGPVIH